MSNLNVSRRPFIDSHCHIDLISKNELNFTNFKNYMSENKETFPKNYAGCVAVFCYPRNWCNDSYLNSFIKPLLRMDGVWATVGCHPKDASSFSDLARRKLVEILERNRKVVAVGEMGLDYSKAFFKNQKELQIKVFREQLEVALKLNLPAVIHSRDAEEDTLDVLLKSGCKYMKMHRHCFTGTLEEAEMWLELFPNSYIGLTPIVTYSRKNPNFYDIIKYIPLNKLLLETDSPYFVPRMMSGSSMKQSHPGMAMTVALEIAHIKSCSVEVLDVILRNTMHMYSIRI